MEYHIHVCVFISSIGFHRKGSSQIEICLIFSPTCEASVKLGAFWVKYLLGFYRKIFFLNLHIPISIFDSLHVHNSSSFQFKGIILR